MLFEKTYGIDLGSSSVKVYSFFRNKTYIEKNMIASKGHTIIAMGNEAYDMFEKSPTDITVTSPMTFGMIANLELQEIVLYSMIRKIDHILGFGATMYFTVPLDMTAVEKRAYFHVANGHWLKKNRVFMVVGTHCRCHCHGCQSGRSGRKYDRKYRCTEYRSIDHHRRKDHYQQENTAGRQTDE